MVFILINIIIIIDIIVIVIVNIIISKKKKNYMTVKSILSFGRKLGLTLQSISKMPFFISLKTFDLHLNKSVFVVVVCLT